MNKLISMTDFVIEQRKTHEGDFEDLADLYYRYAKFLKQPLELWMFVPCDEDGNVFQNPLQRDYNNVDINNSYFKEYQQAKKRCLFEGFICNTVDPEFLKLDSIECLIDYDINLTQTAIKQLGL